MKFVSYIYLLVSLSIVYPLLGASKTDWDALILALKKGDLAAVQKLVPSVINVTSQTRGGKTPLMIINYHIGKWQEIENYLKSKSGSQATASGPEWDALLRAIEEGNVAKIKELVPAKIGPSAKTRGGKVVATIPGYLKNQGQKIKAYFESLGSAPSAGPGASTAGKIYDPSTGFVTYFDKNGVQQQGIGFYDRNAKYYAFTNFYAAPITLDGKQWPTTEHYFQAKKFKDAKLQEQIRTAPSPRAAFDLARQHNASKRNDWEKVKRSIMKKAVQAKFAQHQNLASLLIATAPYPLVELAMEHGVGKDFDWGYPIDLNTGQPLMAPHNGQPGRNMLGEILGEVRNELGKQKGSAGPGAPSASEGERKQARSGGWGAVHDRIEYIFYGADEGEVAPKHLEEAVAKALTLQKKNLLKATKDGKTLYQLAVEIDGAYLPADKPSRKFKDQWALLLQILKS